ncbi:hypothetical protein EV361DRAFT_385424 [Lentinula raphanica]|nr:hypothetical protein EV361DRAFT_385424 [Lentinula raphanica]
MALFLSKVFGRRKHEDKASTSSKSSASPLEGKFEYVIPSPSPEKGPDYPHLSLSFPEHQETRVLSSIFENGDVAGKKRLSPEQALTIIRACSQVIVARGLETLGIMHPHWHSASPATQQRLILLFIQSSAAEFESEVNSTRSAHDVAAVFRWAIRHLELSGPFFGQKEAWYHDFFEAEKSASYPPKSFAQILAPQLPATNLELLTTAVDLFSSLAAHSEANGISGSKLSKSLGLWLLTSERSTPGDDFLTFYAKWDKYGRMMEHLFLSHIRNEIANHRMPKRLVELVKHYPYTGKDQSSTEEYLLPRPRFSTRRYDALFVHIDTENSSPRAAKVSLQMVADALNAITPSSDTPPYSIWRKVQQNASAGDEELLYSPSTDKFPGVGRILSDETLGILSLLAEDVIQRESSITFIPRADSPQETGSRNTTSYSRLLSASSSDTVTVQRPNLDTLGLNVDWNSFSSSGFSQSSPLLTPLAETLLESKDSEVTSPSRKGSKKSVKTPGHRSRRSLDVLPPITIPVSEPQIEPIPASALIAQSNSRVTRIDIIPLDESFIDFWNDSLLDPITDVETWPKFVVCKLKTSVTSELVFGEGTAGKKVEWIVVEQHYVKPTPNISSNPQLSPTNPSAETSEGPSVERASSPQSPFKRASSPRPSLSSVNASMKRFSFWGGSKKDKGVTEDVTTSTKKKKGKGVKVGEMGEILAEENKSPVAASPHKKALEVPVAVQEEQESRDVAKNEQAAEAKAEVGEAIPVSEIAAVTVMEKVQDDRSALPETEEFSKDIKPVAIETANDHEEKDQNGITPVTVSQQEKLLVEESSPAPSQDDENALNESVAFGPVPNVASPAVAVTVTPELYIDGQAVQELVPNESATEGVVQPPDVQESEIAVEQVGGTEVPTDKEPQSRASHITAATEAVAVNEPVADVSELDAIEKHVTTAFDAPIQQVSTDPSISEEPVLHHSSASEPAAVSPESAKSVENVVRSSEELVEDDTLEPPETSASHKEEIAPVDEPTAPEARLPATLSNPEPVSQEDAPQPASQEDAPTVSDIQSQPDHVEEVSLNLEPTSKDVPETTSVPENIEPALPNDETTEQTTEQSNEDVPMNLPEEAELPSITEELISGPTGQQLPETSTNEHLVNSTSATSSPAEIPEVPIVLEPVVILPENDVPEAGDDSFDEIAAASSLESPEIVPAPDQEVPGPTEDVEIEHKEAEITKDLETEVALEQLASTPSVDLVPESAEGILPEDEEDPPAPSLETAENAEEVADEIEPHVRSELIREPAPGLEDDHVSLSEVPIVDAPVIPPASPSVPSLDTSTPEEEQGMESQTPVGDSPSELSQNQLPPAPETVVLSGGTVGPALALSSSEVTASAPADEPGHAEDESQTVEDDSKASDEDGAVNIEGSEGVETDPQTSEPHKVESHNEAERK